MIFIGDMRVNFEANSIIGPDGSRVVEPKVMRLLEVLSAQPGTVFSREELISSVWGVEHGGDERLSRAVSLLRKALGEVKGERKYIETISRRGYRLIAEVSKTQPLSPEAQAASPELAPDVKIIPTVQADRPTNISMPSPNRSRLLWLSGAMAALVALATIWILPQLLTLTGAQQAQQVDRPVSELLAEGLEHIRFFGRPGAIEAAESNFRSALGQDPDNATAHAGLALAYIRKYTASESDPTLLKQAKSSALRALDENEHLALSHIAMGWSAEFDLDYDKALRYLDRGDLLDLNNDLVLESRIRIMGNQENFDRAGKLVVEALNLYPDNPTFHSLAAQINFVEGDRSAAETFALKAIDLDPQNPWLYASAAQILHDQDKTTEAVKVIQDGLEVQENAALYNNLGTYLFFQGYYDLSASAFEKTLEIEGNTHDPQSWANLGDAYRWVPDKQAVSREKYQRAIQLWRRALDEDPSNFSLQSRLVLYEAKMEVGEVPIDYLKAVIGRDDLHSTLYYRALVTAELHGERDMALNLLKKSINSGYPQTEIRNDPELGSLREDQRYHLIMSQ